MLLCRCLLLWNQYWGLLIFQEEYYEVGWFGFVGVVIYCVEVGWFFVKGLFWFQCYWLFVVQVYFDVVFEYVDKGFGVVVMNWVD